MLVSGGKVIAIDSIKKGNTNKDTLSGDGVWTDLGVNTDVIATTKKLNDTKSELESKINSASSALSGEIKKKQDELKFELNEFNKITAIGPKNGTTTALAGGSNVVVSAGANTRVDSAASGEQTIYTVNVTANPTEVTVSGEHGLSARLDRNTYYLGLNNNYIQAITSVNSKLPITAFTTYLADHKNDDVQYYSAGNYIEITNHKIIGHDWTNTIKSASSNAVTTVESRFKGDGSSYSGYNGKPFIDNTTPKWSVVGDGNRISVTSANNKYGVSWNGEGIATEEWVLGKNYLPKDVASSTYLTIASANEIYQKKLNAGAGIVIKNETDISVDISVSGDIIPYSAGEGIGIDNHIVSITADYLSANALKDLSGRWESAANALEASADNWNKTYKDVSDSAKYWNSAYDALASADKWNTTYERVELSGDEWDKVSAKLDSATFKTYSALMEQKLIDLDDKNLDVSSFSSISSDFALKTEVQEEFEQTSAWVKDNFLSANALDNLSGNWESTYKTVETNSAKWETAYETLTSNSADWDEVSAKLNSATFATYSADIKSTIETFSGEFVELSGDFTAHSADSDLHLSAGEREKWTSAANRVENSAAIWDTVSAKVNKTEFEEFKTSAHNELEKKLDKVSFESWSANKDYDFYSAGNGIKIENHIVSVSADYALSADVYNKAEVDEKIANFGGYTTANADASGYPNVDKPSTKYIYLVKMGDLPASSDNYKEWIYTSADAQTNAWECVGETTLDLTPYLTKDEAANTYQPIGDYVVSSTDVIKPGSAWVLVNDNDNVQWSGLDVSELGKKYIVKSTNGTIGVGSATVGNVITYDLSGAKIVGENGISAEFNHVTNEWNVGLEDYNDIGFAKYSSSANVYTASAVVDGYTEDLNVNPTKITLDNDQILLKTGFYHVDVQTNFTIANPDNNYYNVFVKSIPNAASITQMIDGSYAHTETVDLSFDIRITNDDTPLEISVENFKTNETFAISNLNIHEIVSMPSQIEGGAGNYQAGNGISIGNDTIAAKIGNGLEFNESNAIQVKLGKGLKFDDSQGVQAVTIDSDVNEVVETVQELQESLDTKITDNYPPAMITIADLQVANQTQYAPSNGGMLIGYLFTCPITHKIYAGSNNDYKTKIGIYTKQWSGDNKKVILGIYEYQPDYVNPVTQQVGKTEALCDTGIIELQQGYAEYDVKNLGTKTTHEMKPGCFYYATIYLSYKAGDTNGITLFGAPGYNTQVNNLKPGITITNVNCIHASLYEGLDGYSPDLNFDQMGFSWQYNSYPPSSTSDPYTSQGIVEAHAAGRPYFAIRNVKIVTGN